MTRALGGVAQKLEQGSGSGSLLIRVLGRASALNMVPQRLTVSVDMFAQILGERGGLNDESIAPDFELPELEASLRRTALDEFQCGLQCACIDGAHVFADELQLSPSGFVAGESMIVRDRFRELIGQGHFG